MPGNKALGRPRANALVGLVIGTLAPLVAIPDGLAPPAPPQRRRPAVPARLTTPPHKLEAKLVHSAKTKNQKPNLRRQNVSPFANKKDKMHKPPYTSRRHAKRVDKPPPPVPLKVPRCEQPPIPSPGPLSTIHIPKNIHLFRIAAAIQ